MPPFQHHGYRLAAQKSGDIVMQIKPHAIRLGKLSEDSDALRTHGAPGEALALTGAATNAFVPGDIWINEFHYDSPGTDSGEFVEIAGMAGTDVAGWRIYLYNGANGQFYDNDLLSGVITNQSNGFGTISLSYPVNGLQNGDPDGIALVRPDGTVVEFISYDGAFAATNGPASGMTSVNVGVSETGLTGAPAGTSIGRVGTGDEPGDFTWALISDDTPGGVNNGQTFPAAGGLCGRPSPQ